MAIQVGGTTVISNNREVSNVSGFKTVSGSSILGSGDIEVGGGAPWDTIGTWTSASGSAPTLASGSTNGRWFIGVINNGNTNYGTYVVNLNGNNSFMQVTGSNTGSNNASAHFTNYLTAADGNITFYAYNSGGNNPKFGYYYVRGFLAPGGNLSRTGNNPNIGLSYRYKNA